MSKFRDGLNFKKNGEEFKLTIEDIARLEEKLSVKDFKEFMTKISVN